MNKIDNFGQYKVTIGKQLFKVFENEIVTINDQISYLQTHENHIKLEEKCKTQSDEILALRKSTEENIQKGNEIQANINKLTEQVAINNQRTNQLQIDLANANKQFKEKIEKSDEIAQDIKNISQEMADDQRKSDAQIAILRQQMNNSMNQYVEIMRSINERQRIESIGRCFGPFSGFYHIGVKIREMIRNRRS